MSKKKMILNFLVAFAMMCTAWLWNGESQTAYAAAEGTMMSNAVNITFGSPYFKAWTSSSDHLNHFSRIEVPQRGIVTIRASKPNDSEGEYGRLLFTMHDESGTEIWGNDTRNAVDNASSDYVIKVGLEAGTYYLTMIPYFRVTSGVIETNYSMTFVPNAYCEAESNEGIYKANVLENGKMYTGYFGGDASDWEETDCYKFQAEEGTTYKIMVGGYDKISANTTLIDLVTPDGDEDSIGSDLKNKIDINGNNYMLYTAETTGVHYIRFENYNQIQYEYKVGVEKVKKSTQKIIGVKNSYTKYASDSKIQLNAKAKGKITYETSNRKVCNVLSNGTVYIEGCGTATITIRAAETELYKAATKKVKVTVKLNKIAINDITNILGRKLEIDWDSDYEATGYQVQVALNKGFTKGKKAYNIRSKYDDELTTKALKKNKKYYVRLRSYCKTGGKTYYSDWSKVKTIKVKR